MNGFYEQLTKILKREGFALLRQGKGSHEIWSRGSVNVSVPCNCKSKWTANGILKDAGLRDRL